ncbi:hypothetical protein EXIGLDRAFT_842212 [Exidia glandulosa HHB12029]|uniref:Uncharacterized protein n=1 Tax=Exidia glandulosa HHB12029 TaxID=1314781 RepID=A0A165DF41_EXIGL|nr:hypothetical protein EXIGLDRAFT_842212 [Exidia glandulosa HHB12029]
MDDLSFPNLRALCVQNGNNLLGAWFGGSEEMPFDIVLKLDYTDSSAWQVGSLAPLWPAAKSRTAQISGVRVRGIDIAQHSVITTLLVSHVTRRSLTLSYADTVIDDSTECDAILGVFSLVVSSILPSAACQAFVIEKK